MNQHRQLPLLVLDSQSHPCSYLPDRHARHQYLISDKLTSAEYQVLMDRGFRRSGRWVYRPLCDSCQECVPIRVDAARFAPSQSQRRAVAKNKNVNVHIAAPEFTEEKWELYRRYIAGQHGSSGEEDRDSLRQFLFSSPIDTLEMAYRIDGRLIGVGIIDICPDAISSVYFYFDPAQRRRSLGVFSAVCELGECRRLGKPYWYLGYYVRECRKMNYKSSFRPCELLIDGSWQAMDNSLSQRPQQSQSQHQHDREDK